MDGTPTDCVLLAVGALMPERPKFVFSGINHGPNMGEDVLYSGTVSVAMEAVTLGIPGIAISFASRDEELLPRYQGIVDDLVRENHRGRGLPARHGAQHQSSRRPTR